MKTIKIIDLLNKIANDEEVPDKFEYDNLTFKRINNYYVDEDGDSLQNSILTDLTNLNDEVEIIEEDKEIEKIELDGEYIVTYTTGIRQLMNTNKKDRDIYIKKINELIDKVNSLEKKQ